MRWWGGGILAFRSRARFWQIPRRRSRHIQSSVNHRIHSYLSQLREEKNGVAIPLLDCQLLSVLKSEVTLSSALQATDFLNVTKLTIRWPKLNSYMDLH